MGIYCWDWAEEAEKDTAQGILGTSESEHNQQIADAIKVERQRYDELLRGGLKLIQKELPEIK